MHEAGLQETQEPYQEDAHSTGQISKGAGGFGFGQSGGAKCCPSGCAGTQRSGEDLRRMRP